ncbi:MAG: MFS transporter [Shinella sp.]|nr:MFS transporter [Shinella sp.]
MSRTRMSAPPRPRMLQALFNLHRQEIGPVLIVAFFFFCVLSALMVLRPARDALGMQAGLDSLRWLFIGTAMVTFAATPLFGLLVSHLRRLQLIGTTYGGFVLSLITFWGLLMFARESVGDAIGQVFYVWYSVFNLFVTMVFWALLADRFTSDQGKRFFALISMGGTLGAIFGPWLTSQLAAPLGTPNLLLVAGGFLLLALAAAWLLARVAPDRADAGTSATTAGFPSEAERIGGSAWAGIGAVFRSPYLGGIAIYVLLMAVVATFIYFTRLQMVAAVADDTDMRAAILGNVDMWTQIAVLALQLTLTGQIIKRFGLGIALAILPAATAIGFIGLAIYGSFVVLILLEATNSAVQRGITRPAREALFTVVSREDKYKAKAFIDTFVYSGGGSGGAQIEGLLGRLGMGLVALTGAALPLALIWAALGIWLGRAHARRVVRSPVTVTPADSDGIHDRPVQCTVHATASRCAKDPTQAVRAPVREVSP